MAILKLTNEQKQIVREIMNIQQSILTRGYTKSKEKRIEKRFIALGFGPDTEDFPYYI